MISELYGLANEKMGRSMVTLDNLNKDEFTNERTSIQVKSKKSRRTFWVFMTLNGGYLIMKFS